MHADASRFKVAPKAFSRALATTPLDSRDERMAMYSSIAEALTDTGRFIGSVEHDDLTRRLLGLPIARRYSRGGIFIEHFDRSTLQREATPYFSSLRCRPIRPSIPYFRYLLNRLPLKWALSVLRLVSVIPPLREFGEILLLRAEKPVRTPEEGVNRPGSKIVKALFFWRTRKLGKEPIWGDERV